MAHSFVSYRESHVRLNDFDLIFFIFLFMSMARSAGKSEAMERMFSMWVDSIENDGAGNIDLRLDDFLSEDNLCDFMNIIDLVRGAIASLPEEIGIEFLKGLINIKGVNFGTYKRRYALDLVDSLSSILVE